MDRQSIKQRVINMYGGVCANCGYSDIRALQLDHIIAIKKPSGPYGRSGAGLYYAILLGKQNKDDFQVLCANCNRIKMFTHNEFGSYERTRKLGVVDALIKSGLDSHLIMKIMGSKPLLERSKRK